MKMELLPKRTGLTAGIRFEIFGGSIYDHSLNCNSFSVFETRCNCFGPSTKVIEEFASCKLITETHFIRHFGHFFIRDFFTDFLSIKYSEFGYKNNSKFLNFSDKYLKIIFSML